MRFARFAAIGILSILSPLAQSQPAFQPNLAGAGVSPKSQLVSPEILPNNGVIFRLAAPHATEVSVTGNWNGAPVTVPMTKDESGVWSLLVGPLKPELHGYNFNLDGVRIIDPANPDTMREGQLLGEEVIRVMTGTTKMSGNVAIWGAEEMLTCPGRQRTNTGREGSPGKYRDGPPVDLRLGVLGIDDIALATVDAEVYTQISLRLKKQSPLSNTVMVTLANGRANSGYVPNDAAFGAYTFQVLGSRLKPGCAEQGIANGLSGLIRDRGNHRN